MKATTCSIDLIALQPPTPEQPTVVVCTPTRVTGDDDVVVVVVVDVVVVVVGWVLLLMKSRDSFMESRRVSIVKHG